MEVTSPAELIAALTTRLGAERVITDAAQRELFSADFYSTGTLCTAVIRPADTASLASAAAMITRAGHALVPRGGGMSYTGGITPPAAPSVVVDLGDVAGIVALSPEDMTLTVRAGTTWETIYAALKPHGLRLPVFGTFSGRRATVGGGLSNGAVFFGTARYGTVADHVLGLEVVCADGRVLRTGQAAFRNGKPFYRTQGPDLTGLFLHDCGALGIKTEATFRLIEAPGSTVCLSFAFPDAAAAAAGLSAVGRAGVAEDAYVFDPASTARGLEDTSLAGGLRALGNIVAGQRSALAGLAAGARVVAAGKRVVPEDAYSLHVVCAGRSDAAAQADAGRCRELAAAAGGVELANSIPLAIRAGPFDNLSVIDPGGERWVALNAKLPHADAPRIIAGFDAILAGHGPRLAELGISVSTLFIAMGTHAFSFEPVFHWPGAWLPPHRAVTDAAKLARLREPAPNPAADALVADLRRQTLALFSELGAASNQLGRTYPYRDNLAAETATLLDAMKRALDPEGRMNPGALGWPTPGSTC